MSETKKPEDLLAATKRAILEGIDGNSTSDSDLFGSDASN